MGRQVPPENSPESASKHAGRERGREREKGLFTFELGTCEMITRALFPGLTLSLVRPSPFSGPVSVTCLPDTLPLLTQSHKECLDSKCPTEMAYIGFKKLNIISMYGKVPITCTVHKAQAEVNNQCIGTYTKEGMEKGMR